jgi:hypothetical protein
VAAGAYTFVIADLAGYTALTEAHGGAEAAKTVARYTELASNALSARARLTERVGDQVLIVSEDPCSAVTTALRLRDAVDHEPLFLGVRIGMESEPWWRRAGGISGPRSISQRALPPTHGGDRFSALRLLHQPQQIYRRCAVYRSELSDSKTSHSRSRCLRWYPARRVML